MELRRAFYFPTGPSTINYLHQFKCCNSDFKDSLPFFSATALKEVDSGKEADNRFPVLLYTLRAHLSQALYFFTRNGSMSHCTVHSLRLAYVQV